MKKRVLSLLGAAVLLVTAVGCGGSKTESDASQTDRVSSDPFDTRPSFSTSGTVSESVADDGTGSSGGSTTRSSSAGKTESSSSMSGQEIIVWISDPGSQQLKLMLRGAEDFKKKTGITVSLYPQATSVGTISTFDDKLIPAISAGNAPDVYTANSYYSEYALDVTDYLTDDYTGQMFDVVLPTVRRDGRVYCFSTGVATNGLLLYSKKDFKNAGLDPNVPPKTIAELDAYAEKLYKTNANGDYSVVGFYPWYWYMTTYPDLIIRPFGGRWSNAEGYPTANCAENIQALKWMMSYADKYNVSKVDTSLSRLADETGSYGHSLAMFCAFGAHITNLAKSGKADEWGVAGFPTVSGSKTNLTVDVSPGLSVLNTTTKKDASVAWCKYYTGSEFQSKYVISDYTSYAIFSPNKSAWQQNMSTVDPVTKMLIEEVVMRAAIPSGRTAAKYSTPSSYYALIKSSIAKILDGQVEIQAEMDSLQRKVAAMTKSK